MLIVSGAGKAHRLDSATAHRNYICHSYTGHDHIGHSYIGHDCIGQNNIRHTAHSLDLAMKGQMLFKKSGSDGGIDGGSDGEGDGGH